MPMTVGSWISLGISALALLITVMRNGKTDAAKQTEILTRMESRQAVTDVKLENIQVSLAELTVDERRKESDIREVRDRVIAVEESAKQAHKRIDGIPGISKGAGA